MSDERMEEAIVSNKKYVLACVRYEFLTGKPVYEAYQSLCDILGDNVMNYPDFDFWYYRFSNGNYELDYDRSKDPPPPELVDIPDLVVDKIIGNFDWTARCLFRKVSKKCRLAADRPHVINEIEFKVNPDWIYLTIDNELLAYQNFRRGSCRIGTHLDDGIHAFMHLLFEFGDHAHNDFSIAIGNPNVQIKKLWIKIKDCDLQERLSTFLNSLDHYIHVESFKMEMDKSETSLDTFYVPEDEIEVQDEVLAILSRLKPGILKTIELRVFDWDWKMSTNELARTEQWLQAKEITIDDFQIDVDIDSLLHFNKIEVFVEGISGEEVLKLKNAFLDNEQFEECHINIMGTYMTAETLKALGTEGFPFRERTVMINLHLNSLIFTKI
uniref:F-box domain-containing protein n=1 Tax=Caenorhabditis tropicalis TaxID=1561998 RepID=A0A1I7UPB8_9PELO